MCVLATPSVIPIVFAPDNGQRRWVDRSWFRLYILGCYRRLFCLTMDKGVGRTDPSSVFSASILTRAIRRRLEPCLYLTRCKVQNAPREREREVHAIDTVERTLYKSNLEATSRKTLALYCQNTTKRQASPKSLR